MRVLWTDRGGGGQGPGRGAMVVMEGNGGAGKITIGVCVMEKKVFSSPMEQILERLRAFGEFEIIIFGDKVILDDPIEMYVMRTQLAKL